MKVSVICPTNRPQNIPHLVEMFHRQDYEDKELIVVQSEGTIGAKRNKACAQAKGSIIMCMDDDDYFAPDYISRCVEVLKGGADVTGVSSAYFYSPGQKRAWLYEYKGVVPYVLGSGMAFYRHIWERNKYKELQQGEDAAFLANAGRIIPNDYITGFLATIHARNTASHLTLPYMVEIDVNFLKKRLNFEF